MHAFAAVDGYTHFTASRVEHTKHKQGNSKTTPTSNQRDVTQSRMVQTHRRCGECLFSVFDSFTVHNKPREISLGEKVSAEMLVTMY